MSTLMFVFSICLRCAKLQAIVYGRSCEYSDVCGVNFCYGVLSCKLLYMGGVVNTLVSTKSICL